MAAFADALTLVIPTYNRADLLRQSLTAILGLELRDLEVIVVDDGSDVDMAEVVRPFADRIRFVKKAHAGQGAARDAGAALSRREFVMFLDSDDRWLPGGPDRLVEVLRRHTSADLAFGDAQMGNDQDGYQSFTRTYALPDFDGLLAEEVEPGVWRLDPRRFFRHAVVRNPVFTGSVCWRRTSFEKTGGFGHLSWPLEDWELTIRAASTLNTLYCPGLDVAVYLKHDEAITKKRDLIFGAYIATLEQVRKRLTLSESDRALVDTYLTGHRKGWAYLAYDRGDLDAARERYAACLRLGPFDGMIAVMWALSHLPPRTLQALRNVKRRAFA